METQSIKVNIQGRNYVMYVEPDGVESMKKAAEMVNEQVKTYSESYAVNDSRDLLAMCALQLGFQLIEKDSADSQLRQAMDKPLKEIERALGITT